MRKPKDKLNALFGRHSEQNESTDEKNQADKKYDVESENLAVPEIHSKDYEEKLATSESEQNNPKDKESVVFDTLAVPEIHIKKK